MSLTVLCWLLKETFVGSIHCRTTAWSVYMSSTVHAVLMDTLFQHEFQPQCKLQTGSSMGMEHAAMWTPDNSHCLNTQVHCKLRTTNNKHAVKSSSPWSTVGQVHYKKKPKDFIKSGFSWCSLHVYTHTHTFLTLKPTLFFLFWLWNVTAGKSDKGMAVGFYRN